jgi:hypothetical protein
MRPGHHVLVDTTQAVGFDTTTFTVHFDVVDRGHHDD